MIRGLLAMTLALAGAAGLVGLGGCGSSGGRADNAAGGGTGRPAGVGRDAAAPAAQAAPVSGVVLVTIDTLRADRVGAYGWRAARTPAIDALAVRGIRADRAFAAAPITLPSHASLLTGLYPPHHGARHNGLRLRTTAPTLAERLRAAGFATGAFVAAFPLDRRFGLDRGFDVYDDALPRGADGKPRNERPGRVVVDAALAWLAQRDTTKPFFLWVHLFEPHAPYDADDAEQGGVSVAGAASSAAPTASAAGGSGAGVDARAAASAARRDAAARPTSPRAAHSVSERYDAEVARADTQVARLVHALEPRAASTLFIVTADHGEAFGEHGELGHSIFVYDTTLRVPLVLAGAGIASSGGDIAGSGPHPGAGTGVDAAAGAGAGADPVSRSSARASRTIAASVSLVDLLPTILDLLQLPAGDVPLDGVSLRPLLSGQGTLAPRALYAESFAPLLDFGWSPLRALRRGDEKYIAAPRPELYDLARDAAETRNIIGERDRDRSVRDLAAQVDRISPATIVAADVLSPPAATASPAGAASPTQSSSPASQTPAAAADATRDRETQARLQSLGYLASSGTTSAAPSRTGAASRGGAGMASGAAAVPALIDPKDRIAMAARIAEVTSGELHGRALRAALERLVADDPRNGQMQMRLGVVLQEAGDCRAAVPHYRAAIAASVPSADPHLGLAECLSGAGRRDEAQQALLAADRIEPGNPIVAANLGLLALEEGRTADAIARLRAALVRVPDLHAVRFALARAYGRAGQRDDALRETRELLARLPSDAPQRAEVQRLLAALQ